MYFTAGQGCRWISIVSIWRTLYSSISVYRTRQTANEIAENRGHACRWYIFESWNCVPVWYKLNSFISDTIFYSEGVSSGRIIDIFVGRPSSVWTDDFVTWIGVRVTSMMICLGITCISSSIRGFQQYVIIIWSRSKSKFYSVRDLKKSDSVFFFIVQFINLFKYAFLFSVE